eukprot:6181767-Pleurochrysis_carterae.AAC.1
MHGGVSVPAGVLQGITQSQHVHQPAPFGSDGSAHNNFSAQWQHRVTPAPGEQPAYDSRYDSRYDPAPHGVYDSRYGTEFIDAPRQTHPTYQHYLRADRQSHAGCGKGSINRQGREHNAAPYQYECYSPPRAKRAVAKAGECSHAPRLQQVTYCLLPHASPCARRHGDCSASTACSSSSRKRRGQTCCPAVQDVQNSAVVRR